MAAYFISKDKKIRFLAAFRELRLLRLKYFLNSSMVGFSDKQKLNFLFAKTLKLTLPYFIRSKNRCVLTARSGSVFRFFRLSRIMLKNSASLGELTGVRKSS